MLVLLASFLLLSAIIVVAGIYLARFGSIIADRSGMGGTLVGLVLIAAATSLPELAVNCVAVRIPAPDLALGAIVGSSLFNLFILALMEFLHGTSHRIISPASRNHAMSAIASVVMTASVAFFILVGDPRLAGRFGLGPIVIFFTYLFFVRLIFLDQLSRSSDEQEEASPSISLKRAIIGYLAMTAIIFVAARYLAPTAEAIAVRSGLGGTFVGTTFVALTTSLPELVTTLAAVRIGAFDLAVGNVFGSNVFNASMLLPIDAFYAPGPILASVSQVHAMTAAAVIMVTGIVMSAMFHSAKRRRGLALEPNASLVVLLSLLAIVGVYFASS